MSTRITIDLPAAASEDEHLRQLLASSQAIALVFRDVPDVKVGIEPADENPRVG